MAQDPRLHPRTRRGVKGRDLVSEWEAQLSVVFPRFYPSSPVERRRAATGEGAGKKHLITGVSLLVTRRWQRLPWVSRFRERRVFCLEARGLQPSLPRFGGLPGLPNRSPRGRVRLAAHPPASLAPCLPGGGA